MNLRANRVTLALLVAVGTITPLVVSSATAVKADPINDKKAQAAALQAQIDANGAKISALSEAYDGAKLRYDQATAAADDAQRRIDEARAQADRLHGLVAARAVDVYKGAGESDPFQMIDSKDLTQLESRSVYASAAASHDTQLVDQLAKAEEELAARKRQIDAARAQAKADKDQVAAKRSAIEAANAQQEALLGQVKGQLATLIAQQRAAQEAAARTRALELVKPRPSGGGGSIAAPDPATIPAPSPAAARAVSYAYQQLGKPYVYAAAGPNSFDCSGLVMYVYGLAGISLPHYSGAQWDVTVHIPISMAQPGDLIFWGPGGSEHEGIYIGGGQIIHAPQTGDVVKISAIWGNPIGAGRVTG